MWIPPRCQLIFDLKGEVKIQPSFVVIFLLLIHATVQRRQLYDGLAVVEAVKLGGSTQLSYVGVEVMSATNQKITVVGDDNALHFESDLRGLVSFKSDHMKK